MAQFVFLFVSAVIVAYVLVRTREVELVRWAKVWWALGLWVLLVVLIDVPIGHSANCGMAPSADICMLGGLFWWPYAAYALFGVMCLLRVLCVGFWRILVVFVCGVASASFLSWRAIHAGEVECMEAWGAHLLFQGSLMLVVLWAYRKRAVALILIGICLMSIMPWTPLSFWHACVRICPGDTIEIVAKKLSEYYYVPDVESSWERIRVSGGRVSLGSPDCEMVFTATDGVHADICVIVFVDSRAVGKQMLAD